MFMNNVTRALSQYEPYGLTDLKNANLMNRVDSKFIMPMAWLSGILDQLNTSYRVLDIKGSRISNYKNQYLDTLPMTFYHDHHNGKLNRFKVRQREYMDTKTSFLEVKFKNNQRRTLKTRINTYTDFFQSSDAHKFIKTSVGIPLTNMHVAQHSGYQRIALANEKTAERLTIDFNLWYSLDEVNKIYLPNTCIAELKQARKTKNSPFYELEEKSQLTPISFSKYCIGCALLHRENIKTNRFKPTLSKLHKLLNQNTSINSNFQNFSEH